LFSNGEKGAEVLSFMLRTQSVLRTCRFATVLLKGSF